MAEERWFEILHPKAGISSVVVGKDTLGFKIDIYGDDPDEHFEGGDQIQDRVSHGTGRRAISRRSSLDLLSRNERRVESDGDNVATGEGFQRLISTQADVRRA